MYSKLVAEFITNSETIVNHLHNLPHHEVVGNLTVSAQKIDSRFKLLENQFIQYNNDLTKYKEYMQNVV